MALEKVGCVIGVVCPPAHPLRKTRAVRQIHNYNCLLPLRSLTKAIASVKPDLIVPSDDLATQHLHELYAREHRHSKNGDLTCALIERSIGAAASFQVVYARTRFLELACEEGIRVPKTEVVANREDLERCAAGMGFPMVLKCDGTSGGDGVRIVRTLEEADRAFRALKAPPVLARALKRTLLDQDMALLWPSLLRRRYVVNAQAHITGRDATSAVVCWNGRVLAGLYFEVLNKQDSGGPSTVLRLIDNADMSTAAEKIVSRLELSGLHGFDFMLDTESGNPYLIEINPRATQIGHLALGPRRDLPSALCGAVSGRELQPAPKVTEKDTIALFPQEWLRNPESPFLRSGYHDVPWEEPELVLLGVRRRWEQSAWYSPQKWLQAFSRARNPQP
jgi:hypothetical protein